MAAILGQFSKGIDGSVSVNFGISGGRHCDRGCKHHPQSTDDDATGDCYAVQLEQRYDRVELAGKLKRHEGMHPARICNMALYELQQRVRRGKPIPWLRISTNGSLSQPWQARRMKGFQESFRLLLSFCREHGIPVHCPVETYAKARFYRAVAGSLAVIRESAQSDERFLSARGAVSTSAGQKGTTFAERILAARTLAESRRAVTGRKCVVCPAVLNTFVSHGKGNAHKRNPRAKCGSCVACSLPMVDIVYPTHN